MDSQQQTALISSSPLPEECRCYSSDQIPFIWEKAKPFIEIALNRGSNYTLNDIYEGLCTKQMQLWMNDDFALVTSIQTDKRNKYCLLITLGGTRMSQWFQYLPIVESWAKDEGAEEMRIYGRRAWIKITGYDVDYIRLSKKL